MFVRDGTAPITQALLGLLEDTRAEMLAWQTLPGLRRLWARQHRVGPDDGDDFETLLQRLSRALIDPDYRDPHPWVGKGRAGFWRDGTATRASAHWRDPYALRQLASALGHDIGQLRMGFNARLYRPQPNYRDDNRWLWHSDEQQSGLAHPLLGQQPGEPTELAVEPLAEQPAQWRYPEWDRRIGCFRAGWCSVTERWAPEVAADDALQATPGLTRTLVPLLRSLAAGGQRCRHHEREGDQIALDAALQHAVLRRQRVATDARLYRRIRRMPGTAAAMLLLDTSASGAQPIADAPELTALALHQRLAVELAGAMQAAGWCVAIQGFRSAGRHRVEHQCVLDFAEVWSAAAARRLAGLQPALSTRLGAVLRHAAWRLGEQPVTLRLIVVLSDAQPHDIDVHEPGYLETDTREALRAARAVGIHSLCLMPAGQFTTEAQWMFGNEPCMPICGATDLIGILRALQRCMF